MLRFCIILSLAVSFTLYGCATVYNPATERNEFIFITTATEVSIGNMVATKVESQFKISKDPQMTNRVTETGERIAKVSDRKDLKYYFNVIEDESLNAFTTPGGHIYVNSGLVEKANDDELACVIGHEVGHVAARHMAKKLQAQIGYDILMNIAARTAGSGELQQAASVGYSLISLGYSREDELLSDKLGVKYAYKADYDPYAMLTFLKKLQDSKKEEMGFIFLRSHPYTDQRIKTLETEIPTVIEKVDRRSALRTTPFQKQEEFSVKSLAENKKRPLKVMCPVCRRIFSGMTGYCPYDGTRLE